MRRGVCFLHLDSLDSAPLIGENRVKKLWSVHREQQKGKSSVGQEIKTLCRKPDRVRQANANFVVRRDKRQCAEQRVTEPMRVLLHHITDWHVADLRTVIVDDVGFV